MNNKYIIFLTLVLLLVLFYLYNSKSENFSFSGTNTTFKNILVSDEKGNIGILDRAGAESQLTNVENSVKAATDAGTAREGRLNSAINTERARAIAREGQLNSAINTEKARAEHREGEIISDYKGRDTGIRNILNTKAPSSGVYTKTQVDNALKRKQNTGNYVTRNTWYRLYSDRDKSLYIQPGGWNPAQGAGNAASWEKGYRFQITQQDKR